MTRKPASKKPLEPRSTNPSLNSRLRAATDIQSVVTPEEYPEADRKEQTRVMGTPGEKKASRGRRR